MNNTLRLLLVACAFLFPVFQTYAQPHGDDAESTPPQAAAPSSYTLPWQLRPVMAGNVVRLDSATSFYNDVAGNPGSDAASILTASYKLAPDFAAIMRLGLTSNSPYTTGSTPGGVTSFVNPLIGGLYSVHLADDFRLGLFLGVTLPVGMGGGNTPDAGVKAANLAGILTRSAMDNALFAVNYMTVIPGVGLAYMKNGFTAQVEATVLELMRVQGELVDKDPTRTNFTSGFELGYAVSPLLTLQGELRYQRWIDNATVYASANPAADNLSFAIGPRFTFKIGNMTLKPGIAYAQGLEGAIATSGYSLSQTNSDKVLFVDIPFFF